MPRKYGSPVTCWRRLIRWQREGVWDNVWRGMLRNSDDQKRLDWVKAYLDASFAAAKKGRRSWSDQGRQGHETNDSRRWRGDSAGWNPGGGGPSRDPIGRTHSGSRLCSPAAWPPKNSRGRFGRGQSVRCQVVPACDASARYPNRHSAARISAPPHERTPAGC